MQAQPDRDRSSQFTALLTASGVSGVGDGIRQAAFPLLTAFVTRSPVAVAVAVVAVGQTVPWLLFTIPTGALVDRWDRRRVILTVNVIRGMLTLALSTLIFTGSVTRPVLVVAAFVLSTAEIFADTAGQALLPALVPEERLEHANGRLFAVQTGSAQLIGPSIGGLLFAVTRFAPFLIDAVSFLLAAVLLRRIHPLTRSHPDGRPMRDQIVEGLSFLPRNRVLRGVAVISLAGNLLLQSFSAVFVLYVLEVLHSRSVVYGAFLAVFAAGVTGGSLLAGRAKRRWGDAAVLFTGAGFMAVPLLAIALVANVYVVAGVMLLSGLGMGLWQVIASSLRQSVTRRWPRPPAPVVPMRGTGWASATAATGWVQGTGPGRGCATVVA